MIKADDLALVRARFCVGVEQRRRIQQEVLARLWMDIACDDQRLGNTVRVALSKHDTAHLIIAASGKPHERRNLTAGKIHTFGR
jgi:L-arabinose isomerase